jgi:carbamoyl-phosphate synthase small subunit
MNNTQIINNSTKTDAILILPDGTVFKGFGIGKKNQVFGEICFNTSITGYQEILSDPSYCGQIITFTFPHIGNVGTNDDDLESQAPKASGLIVRESITSPSNYRSSGNLNDWLIKNNLTGISGIDTRKLTKIIREKGAKNIAIIYQDSISESDIKKVREKLNEVPDLNGVELAKKASVGKSYPWGKEASWNPKENIYDQSSQKKYRVVAVDYGAKLNILRCLTAIGCEVFVVPANATIDDILKHKPDGVFLSNGPGDPFETGKYAIPTINSIIEKNIPLFGICLGHQLLALACGAKTSKMHQGHRGANHPVQDLRTKKVEITSQNHGFCVDEKSLPDCLEVTHISLFDKTIEGIKVKDKKAFSVQYHPESSPGPIDSFYLFEEFANLMEQN